VEVVSKAYAHITGAREPSGRDALFAPDDAERIILMLLRFEALRIFRIQLGIFVPLTSFGTALARCRASHHGACHLRKNDISDDYGLTW
jgi:hypothetical protein